MYASRYQYFLSGAEYSRRILLFNIAANIIDTRQCRYCNPICNPRAKLTNAARCEVEIYLYL